MVHSPIAVHPEAADKDWAAPGTFPLGAPSPGQETFSRLGAKCPPIKESNKIFKNPRFPSPFIVLKTGKMGKETQARPTDGQLARSGERARTSGAVRGSGLSRGWPGEGAGRSGVAAQVRELARPSEVFERHSLPGLGAAKGPGTNPRAWHFSGHWRPCAAACEAGAERAEPVAGLGNPRPPPLIRPCAVSACVTPGRRRGAERCVQ